MLRLTTLLPRWNLLSWIITPLHTWGEEGGCIICSLPRLLLNLRHWYLLHVLLTTLRCIFLSPICNCLSLRIKKFYRVTVLPPSTGDALRAYFTMTSFNQKVMTSKFCFDDFFTLLGKIRSIIRWLKRFQSITPLIKVGSSPKILFDIP